MPEANAGIGASGVPRGGQLETDLLALSDPAKRIAETRKAAVEANAAKNLKMLEEGQAMRAQSLNDQAADFVMNMLKPNAERDPKGYMQSLELRVADMETKAKEVKASKSGNVQAEQTYQQVAEILRKRLRAMQDEQMQAASQPAQSAPPMNANATLPVYKD